MAGLPEHFVVFGRKIPRTPIFLSLGGWEVDQVWAPTAQGHWLPDSSNPLVPSLHDFLEGYSSGELLEGATTE